MNRRTISRVFLLVLATAVVAACGASLASTGKTTQLADFRSPFVEFTHPPTWSASEPPTSGSLHFHPLIYLSAQPTRDPCRTQGGTVACGWPVQRLKPGGVLVVWENRGYPGWTLASAAGTRLRIGDRPARRAVSRPGACKSIGADETVEIAIARPLPSNWTAVTACLRSPNLAASEQQLDALLASIKFKAP